MEVWVTVITTESGGIYTYVSETKPDEDTIYGWIARDSPDDINHIDNWKSESKFVEYQG